MNLFSIFSKKAPEPTSVAEALAGVGDTNMTKTAAKAKARRNENRHADAQNEQLVPEKKRARRRLIGAVAIVLAVVIGLPMVLDSEPKPLSKNIIIQIPSKDPTSASVDIKEDIVVPETTERATSQSAKQPAVALADTPQRTVTPVVQQPIAPPAASNASTGTEMPKLAKSDNKSDAKHSDIAAKKDSTTKPKADIKSIDTRSSDFKSADTKSADSRPTKSEESARAIAILGGSNSGSSPSTKSATRIVVQVGAFATQEKVTELQEKLSSAGIKSFTQKVATSSGDKIRVRIGPFSDKESADKMKLQLEKLGLNGTMISL